MSTRGALILRSSLIKLEFIQLFREDLLIKKENIQSDTSRIYSLRLRRLLAENLCKFPRRAQLRIKVPPPWLDRLQKVDSWVPDKTLTMLKMAPLPQNDSKVHQIPLILLKCTRLELPRKARVWSSRISRSMKIVFKKYAPQNRERLIRDRIPTLKSCSSGTSAWAEWLNRWTPKREDTQATWGFQIHALEAQMQPFNNYLPKINLIKTGLH